MAAAVGAADLVRFVASTLLAAALGLSCGAAGKAPGTSPAPGSPGSPLKAILTTPERFADGTQLVIYARQSQASGLPLSWEIRKIALDKADGTQVSLPGREVALRTDDLAAGQKLVSLTEAPEGEYKGLTLFTRGVYFTDTGEPVATDATLTTVDHPFSVVSGNATTIALVTDLAPPGSSRASFQFKPAVTVDQEPAAVKGKAVYVSNELSSNISVIDKAAKRVAKNVFVGLRPSSVAADQRRNRLYIADRKAGAVYEMDMIGQILLKATQLEFVDEPVHIEPLPVKDMLMVVNFGSDTVCLLDAFTLQVAETIPVGDGPVDAVYSPIWDLAFVVNLLDNSLSVIDFETQPPAVDTTIEVGLRPTGITIDDSMGWLYVSNSGSTDMSVIKLETMAVERTVSVGMGAGDIMLDPYGRRLFLSMTNTNEILCVDPYTGVLIYSVRLPSQPGRLMFDPDEKKLYAAVPARNAVVVVDTITREIQDWIETGERPSGVALRL
jgi:YVTN family beta-propeller protein